MFEIVLYQPMVPPNTGNIMRLCANTSARLHLVGPIAFDLDDARLRRAGLDYRDRAAVSLHRGWADAREALGDRRWWAFSGSGGRHYDDVAYQSGDALLFGPERHGLPEEVLAEFPGRTLRIPMLPDSRSLNLSNAVSVVVYEAWRQSGFRGGV